MRDVIRLSGSLDDFGYDGPWVGLELELDIAIEVTGPQMDCVTCRYTLEPDCIDCHGSRLDASLRRATSVAVIRVNQATLRVAR